MPTKRLTPPALALLALTLPAHAAQNTEPLLTAEVVVSGLAVDDLLNIRATASATGMVIGRLPNGTALRNFGCDEVKGYQWCRIALLENEKLHGWTPARYLQPVEGSGPIEAAPADRAAADNGTPVAPEAPGALPASAEEQAAVPAGEPPQPAETAASDAPAAAPAPAGGTEAGAVAVLDDLSERFGGDASGTLASGSRQALAPDGRTDAVALALQTAFSAVGGTEAAASGEDGARSSDAAPPVRENPAPAAEAAPDRLASASVEPQGGEAPAAASPALAMPPGSDDRIPCARYVGQAMTLCRAAVARTGVDAADVTVTMPDNGSRTIHFRNGKPDGSNSQAPFRFTREGELNMIRIGTAERFEIPDALVFGG